MSNLEALNGQPTSPEKTELSPQQPLSITDQNNDYIPSAFEILMPFDQSGLIDVNFTPFDQVTPVPVEQHPDIREIYTGYSDRIYSYVYHRIGDSETAADITIEVFIRAMEADESTIRMLQPWLYQTAHNLIVDHFRRAKIRSHPSLDDPDFPQVSYIERKIDAVDPIAELKLQNALLQLTSMQRDVVLLRYYGGLKFPEIAEIIGKNLKAVKQLHLRGLRRLREIVVE